MKSGIAGRRVWAVVLVAALLIVVSGLLELGSVVRLATERAATEWCGHKNNHQEWSGENHAEL